MRPLFPRSVDASAHEAKRPYRAGRIFSRSKLLDWSWPDWLRPPPIGLDLGSEISRAVEVRPGAEIVRLPSALATDTRSGTIVAVGEPARRMIGRLPAALQVHAPIQKGVIAQPAEAEFLIRQLLRQARRRRSLFRPHVVIAVPTEATSVQRHALRAAAESAGAGRVTIVREALAAGLGAGLPILEAGASLILEMGAEKSEIAVISLGGIVSARAVAVGGSDISEAVALHLRREHHLIIGRATADAVKHRIASATEMDLSESIAVSGRDVRVGRPASIEIKSNDLVKAIADSLQPLRAALRDVLERTPPELARDLTILGVHLSGGASRLRGLDAYLGAASGLEIHRVEAPEDAVVRGCRKLAASPELLRELCPAD
jgi:rod shape-determining protein MreB